MQKSPPTKEPGHENENIRSILTIGEALYFKYEMKDGAISTIISSPNFVSDSTTSVRICYGLHHLGNH